MAVIVGQRLLGGIGSKDGACAGQVQGSAGRPERRCRGEHVRWACRWHDTTSSGSWPARRSPSRAGTKSRARSRWRPGAAEAVAQAGHGDDDAGLDAVVPDFGHAGNGFAVFVGRGHAQLGEDVVALKLLADFLAVLLVGAASPSRCSPRHPSAGQPARGWPAGGRGVRPVQGASAAVGVGGGQGLAR